MYNTSIPLNFNCPHFIVEICTDHPTEWAIGAGWTCQDYVDKGLNMNAYCSKDAWIENQNCGETCASYGMITDPNCI